MAEEGASEALRDSFVRESEENTLFHTLWVPAFLAVSVSLGSGARSRQLRQ